MSKLKIAIQKSGRLSEKSVNLIAESGIKLTGLKQGLVTQAQNFPIELLFLRDDDIPQYVADKVADVGIVGENVVMEKNPDLPVVERLGFGNCRMSLAVSKNIDYKGIRYFQNKKIATSYPKILLNFLKKEGIEAEIHEISGSVEIAPGIGLADAVFDIVSTGSTLMGNGLKEVETVMRSEAVIIKSSGLDDDKEKILAGLLFRIRAVKRAGDNKYILLNVPNDKIDKVVEIIPGMKSPTIVPLATKGWSSVHSVVNENDFWEVIDKLKENGAQGILVVPIEKMIV